MDKYFDDESFKSLKDLSSFQSPSVFEDCNFHSCQFSNSDLSSFKFINCEFHECDLSNCKVVNTAFQNVTFKRCKLLGIQFDTCNQMLFEVSFDQCQMDHCNFHQVNCTMFKATNCSLKEVDFSNAHLPESIWSGSNLDHAVFDQSNLKNADFRNVNQLRIDPSNNQIKHARLNLDALPGLLIAYDLTIE